MCNTVGVWYLCIPVAKMTQFQECCIITTLFCSLLRIYQLVYAVKTVAYRVKQYRNGKIASQKRQGARATPRYPVRIYTETHRSGFYNGDIMSHIQRNTLDTASFLGITAEQEQVVKLFKLKLRKK